jgi:hypothetical protein
MIDMVLAAKWNESSSHFCVKTHTIHHNKINISYSTSESFDSIEAEN